MSSEAAFNQLIQTLRDAKNLPAGQKPVFWLGAGCSVFDGIPLNAALLKSINRNSPGIWGSEQYRFDDYFHNSSPQQRAVILERKFRRKLKSHSPYRPLVELMARGYIDMVATFNIDTLIDQALNESTHLQRDRFAIYSAPDYKDEVLVQHVLKAQKKNTLIIVKLHGEVGYGINLMTSHEIADYEPGIGKVCAQLSERPAVVCGYSFMHLNVLLNFSRAPSPLFYVSPHFPETPTVLSMMSARNKSSALFIDGDLGRFERFMPELLSKLH